MSLLDFVGFLTDVPKDIIDAIKTLNLTRLVELLPASCIGCFTKILELVKQKSYTNFLEGVLDVSEHLTEFWNESSLLQDKSQA